MHNHENSKKAVAYIRISSMRQIDNESPATQREAIQRYADANNITIVKWFEDIAKSGKNVEREGLQQLLNYCLKNRGSLEHWIVYNMRRASRDIESYTTIINSALKGRGITIRSATEPAIDDTKEGRFLETLFVALGQLDNEGKAEVTVDNMRSLTMQGYWLNAPVLGYDICKVANSIGKPRPSLKPNQMAQKVKQTLERYSEGDISKADLARYAKEIGLRSRYNKVLSHDSIHRLIKHPVYAGFISNSFTEWKLVEAKHPPIISVETYERNQGLLYGLKSRKGETHLKINKTYPLKGLILCISCGNLLYASAPRTGNGQTSPRYHCARKQCKGKVKSIKASLVHDDFERMLHKIKPTAGVLKLYKEILIREANKQLGRLNNQIEDLRNGLSDISNSRNNTVQKYVDGYISLEEKNQLVDSLDSRKISLQSELKELESLQNIREADIELAIELMENVDKQWAHSDFDVKIRFQNMLFPRGVVYDYETGKFGTSEISPLYRCVGIEKAPEGALDSYLVAGAGLEPATLWL